MESSSLNIKRKHYSTVVIDPPWKMAEIGIKGGVHPAISYEMMDIKEIAKLPVRSWLRDDALVFTWTINRYLPRTFEILDAWGVRYCFTMTWVKTGGVQTPVSPCLNSEWIIVGKHGNPKFLDIKDFRTANLWKRRGHSEKPEEFYDLLRRVTPAPRLDVFGHRRIGGFDSCGNEAPDGETEPGYYQDVMALECLEKIDGIASGRFCSTQDEEGGYPLFPFPNRGLKL